jgi:hypothetical protein
MKQFLLTQIFKKNAKAGDKEVKDLRSAVLKTAEYANAEATLELKRNGDAVLTVDNDAVAEQLVNSMKQLPNITVSGISSPLDAYVQARLHNEKP